MEQSRLFIAIGISFLIFFLWSMFLAPTAPEAPVEVAPETAQKQDETPAPIIKKEPAPVSVPIVPQSTQTARKISVDTPLFTMTISERGAAVTSVVLKEFKETMDDDAPQKELLDKNIKDGNVLISLSGDSHAGLESAVFTLDYTGDSIELIDQSATLRFQHRNEAGMVVEKVYQFTPDSYLVGMEVSLYNGSDQSFEGNMAIGLHSIMSKEQQRFGFEGPSGMIDGNLEQVKIKNIEEDNELDGKIRWVAIESQYFMTSIIPKDALSGQMLLDYSGKELSSKLVIETDRIAPLEKRTFDFNVFMGPKSLSLLRSFNFELDRAIDFGWFDFIAKPCLWFMNFIYGFIPNYGVAIIILTLVSRALFWPLAKKSYKSMGEMRKIQPLMMEIREKYKNDKTRINQETMALYKTYKVNPMGGCLPMLIQMPVFFALYRMLYEAIELRHAPFFGWITDLSAPERLFPITTENPIPIVHYIMDTPYGIPVLTILMGASMLLQQKMSPTTGDPTQAKMMMMMPIVFTFIFLNFSSGLVLYWLVSNIFSIAQQYFTMKQTA